MVSGFFSVEIFHWCFGCFTGELGGQLGLFIGVSVLTICEMFEALVLAISQCTRRRKLRRIAEKWRGMAVDLRANKDQYETNFNT